MCPTLTNVVIQDEVTILYAEVNDQKKYTVLFEKHQMKQT